MHLVPAVSDVQRAHDFYRDVFGWVSHLEWPSAYFADPDGNVVAVARRL